MADVYPFEFVGNKENVVNADSQDDEGNNVDYDERCLEPEPGKEPDRCQDRQKNDGDADDA